MSSINFDRSVLRVLEKFSRDEPKTERDIYRSFGKDVLTLILGSNMSLDQFIEGLAFRGDLTRSGDDAYILSANGLERLKELQQRLHGAAGQADANGNGHARAS